MDPVTVNLASGQEVFCGPVAEDLTVQALKERVLPQVACQKKALLHGHQKMEDQAQVASYLRAGHSRLTLLLCRPTLAVEVRGAWFGHPGWVPVKHDADLKRNVHLLDGVFWFNAGGSFTDLDCGDWRISLRVKRKQRISFNTDLTVHFNDAKVQSLSPEALSSLPEDAWTLLELGSFHGLGSLQVKLAGDDCRQRFQSSKSGLYIDQLVAQPL